MLVVFPASLVDNHSRCSHSHFHSNSFVSFLFPLEVSNLDQVLVHLEKLLQKEA